MPTLLTRNTFLRNACAVLALALGGLVLLPLTRSVTKEQFDTGLRQPLPKWDTADLLSKQLAVFTLGGLRSLAAEILTLDASAAWSRSDWPAVRHRWQQATTLAPQRINYWTHAAYDMAWNASSSERTNPKNSPEEQERLARYYHDEGEAFLQRGIAANPKSGVLYAALASQYADLYRYPQFAKAAAAYAQAEKYSGHPKYGRNAFYNLCRIRGREKEAWELGRRLYASRNNRVTSLLCLLFVLQNKIEVPEHERLSVLQLFGSEERARKEMQTFSRNSLVFPVTGVKDWLREHPGK